MRLMRPPEAGAEAVAAAGFEGLAGAAERFVGHI